MTIANPRIHIICGVCGSNKDFIFTIEPIGNCDNEGNTYPAVFITCQNCRTLTSLDEVMKESR